MTRTDQIIAALEATFSPQTLDVIDESEAHRGHAGYQEGGESHFRIVIRAPIFGDMSRVARHRAIHAALGADLVGQIHALSVDVAG